MSNMHIEFTEWLANRKKITPIKEFEKIHFGGEFFSKKKIQELLRSPESGLKWNAVPFREGRDYIPQKILTTDTGASAGCDDTIYLTTGTGIFDLVAMVNEENPVSDYTYPSSDILDEFLNSILRNRELLSATTPTFKTGVSLGDMMKNVDRNKWKYVVVITTGAYTHNNASYGMKINVYALFSVSTL